MCLIAFAWRSHPRYDLILIANRDEFHARPATQAHFWQEAPGLFAGCDLKAGGAWCGVSRDGRFAAVTNVREPPLGDGAPRSRGALVRDYLIQPQDAREYVESAATDKKQFDGFNLFVADAQDLFYLSNRSPEPIQGVSPGIHAMSNGVFGDEWPKTRRAAQGLQAAIGENEVDADALLTLLADRTPAADDRLPDTGVGAELERFLSPIFIEGEHYGTRCSTVILREPEADSLYFVERSFEPGGEPSGEVREHIAIRSA